MVPNTPYPVSLKKQNEIPSLIRAGLHALPGAPAHSQSITQNSSVRAQYSTGSNTVKHYSKIRAPLRSEEITHLLSIVHEPSRDSFFFSYTCLLNIRLHFRSVCAHFAQFWGKISGSPNSPGSPTRDFSALCGHGPRAEAKAKARAPPSSPKLVLPQPPSFASEPDHREFPPTSR